MKLAHFGLLQPVLCRWLHVSSALRLPVVVNVPPLGDSISEGSIAAILKRNGAEVAENEVIAQIETDKVTIDIRSPIDGRIENILIKEDDVVTPGQTVAVVGELSGASAGALNVRTPAPPSPAPEAVHAETSQHRAAYKPMIQFPPRMTADGQRISSLPAAQAKQYVQQSVEPVPSEAKLAAPVASAVYTDRAPARRELTEEEMEIIMLGGAMP